MWVSLYFGSSLEVPGRVLAVFISLDYKGDLGLIYVDTIIIQLPYIGFLFCARFCQTFYL